MNERSRREVFGLHRGHGRVVRVEADVLERLVRLRQLQQEAGAKHPRVEGVVAVVSPLDRVLDQLQVLLGVPEAAQAEAGEREIPVGVWPRELEIERLGVGEQQGRHVEGRLVLRLNAECVRVVRGEPGADERVLDVRESVHRILEEVEPREAGPDPAAPEHDARVADEVDG